MTNDVEDEALMVAYAAGDAGAFDALYDRHRRRLYGYLRRQVGASADELFQDVWLRVIDARDRYEPRAKFATWLYTIAHNRLMDHFRSAGRLVAIESDEERNEIAADETVTPEHEAARRQLGASILAALDLLPALQREAFLLQQEAGLSVEEIAEATGVNRETAKSRLRYALAKLRRELAALKA